MEKAFMDAWKRFSAMVSAGHSVRRPAQNNIPRNPILTGLILLALLAGCSLPSSKPVVPTMALNPVLLATPTIVSPTPTFGVPVVPSPTFPFATFSPSTQAFVTSPASTSVSAGTQPSKEAFCADSQATALVENLKTALLTSNGPLLASLISPAHGTEMRYYRDGRIVTYDQRHAKFLFESTFEVNWGNSPGSGLPTKGAWHDVILPGLLKTFSRTYTLSCNQLQVGGTTYAAAWDYPAVNFYSAYYPGTAENGNMDWHTWAVGTEYVGGKPYLYALMQFEWEP